MGRAADQSAGLVHSIYGPGTRRLLIEAGIRPGMRVADVGCGVGSVSELLAELIGFTGHVTAIDTNEAQLEQTLLRMSRCGTEISLVQANAMDTGLPAESFDLVYCRFLLMHLPEPHRALVEMRRLLRPGGILVCEDGDVTTGGSEPPSQLDAFAELFRRLGPLRGVDYTLGRRLYHLISAACFQSPQVSFNQPVRAIGEEKRLLELSIAEAGPALVESGLIGASELALTLHGMRRAADDRGVLALMPRMSQVWATRQ